MTSTNAASRRSFFESMPFMPNKSETINRAIRAGLLSVEDGYACDAMTFDEVVAFIEAAEDAAYAKQDQAASSPEKIREGSVRIRCSGCGRHFIPMPLSGYQAQVRLCDECFSDTPDYLLPDLEDDRPCADY